MLTDEANALQSCSMDALAVFLGDCFQVKYLCFSFEGVQWPYRSFQCGLQEKLLEFFTP
jgi:hypothetical protein